MHGRIGWLIFFILMLCFAGEAYSQQDVDFHLSLHLFPGKNILKVKRDFHDPYLWVLAQNNQVYRINSLTLAIDDYTNKFAAYSNLPFIDIAGRSQDTMFVATNSTEVIEYKKGAIKVIGAADGIVGTINSIGVDYTGTYVADNSLGLGGGHIGNTLLIATNSGMCHYDYQHEIITPLPSHVPSKIFEATYRSEMFSDLEFVPYNDVVKQYSVMELTKFTEYGGFIYYGTNGGFGNSINTAYYTSGWLTDSGYQFVIYANQFWGTENGLFQNNWNNSNQSRYGYLSYLPGTKVNKVTSIYGLVNFGQNLIKENLLVGTVNGLYFSDSKYNQQGYINPAHAYTMFHYDEMGNININDICVNATSYTTQICEDGVWVAANNGLYLLKPDYGKYLNTAQTLQAINFENQDQSITSTNLCSGSSATAVINTNIYTGNTFQWYKNENELPGESSNKLTITAAGDYYAVLYDPCSTLHFSSNHLKVTTTVSPTFTFNYPSLISQCGNAPYTLQTEDNPAYQYRWYTNGALNGNTVSNFTATQSGKYKIEVSACNGSWVPSKEVEIDMITLPVPQISPDKTVYCTDDVATLSLNAPADPSYTINWLLNGTVLPADVNQTTIKTTSAGTYTVTLTGNAPGCAQTSAPFQLQFAPQPKIGMFPTEARACNNALLKVIQEGGNYTLVYRWYTNGVLNGNTTDQLVVTESGQYKVEVSACAGSWLSSNAIQVDIVNLPAAALTADKTAYCTGDNATLSITAPADPSYTINWYRDNMLLTAYSNQASVTTNVAGSYTVSIVNNAQNYDGTYCTETTSPQLIAFNTLPTISIEKSANTSLCDGQTANLSANYSGGSIKWSTGQTTDQIAITATGTYSATVTSSFGCEATANINITFLPDPVPNISDASICPNKHQPVTLVAPPGYAQYSWDGQAGSSTYQVNSAQTVSLVVTDINGCTATQQIKVIDSCPDLLIPNVFTPNNDRINDTWVIEGVPENPDVHVSVFNRYGARLYDNTGYSVPWNGEYGGKRVPAGVYYYLITVPNKNKTYSGPLTILY